VTGGVIKEEDEKMASLRKLFDLSWGHVPHATSGLAYRK